MQVPIPFILGSDNRPVENIVLAAGDIRFIGTDNVSVNLTFTTRGFATFVDITDAQAADEGGQIILMDQDDPPQFQPQFSVFPFVEGRLSDVEFQITPPTLKLGSTDNQRLVFTSSVEGNAKSLAVDAIIKANGSRQEVFIESINFEEFESVENISYGVLTLTSISERVSGDEIFLESGDLMIAIVEYGIGESEDSIFRAIAIPVVAEVAESILQNPDVPLANNAQGQLEASNVTIETTGGGSAHTAQDVVDLIDLSSLATAAGLTASQAAILAAILAADHTPADVAAAILANPANLLATDASGSVTTSNPSTGGTGSNHTAADVAGLILANPATPIANDADGAVATTGGGTGTVDLTPVLTRLDTVDTELAKVKKINEPIRHTLVGRVEGVSNTTVESRE